MRVALVPWRSSGIEVTAVLGVGWATFEYDIVVRQHAAVEWTALTQMADALNAGHRPYYARIRWAQLAADAHAQDG